MPAKMQFAELALMHYGVRGFGEREVLDGRREELMTDKLAKAVELAKVKVFNLTPESRTKPKFVFVPDAFTVAPRANKMMFVRGVLEAMGVDIDETRLRKTVDATQKDFLNELGLSRSGLRPRLLLVK